LKQLIRLFYNDPNHSYSIRSLAQKLNKAYSYVYGQVNALAQKGVLKKRKLGAAIYCSLNYGNDDLLRWLIEIEGDNFEEFLKIEKKLSKPLRELKDRLPERTNFNLLSAVLFGSYANDKKLVSGMSNFISLIPDSFAFHKKSWPCPVTTLMEHSAGCIAAFCSRAKSLFKENSKKNWCQACVINFLEDKFLWMTPNNSSFEELLMFQVIQQEALTRLLVEKGIFTKEEFL